MKTIVATSLLVGLCSMQSALASSCYSYTDYESVNNNPAACVGVATEASPAVVFEKSTTTAAFQFSSGSTGDCITQPVAV